MIDRSAALKLLAGHRTDELVVCVMSTNYEWPAFSNNPDLDLRSTSAMGQGSSIGLGLALARPNRKVWVLNADGSQLMALGSLATVANAAPKNLVLFVFENDQYEITGGQPLPLAGRLDFAGVARSLAFKHAYSFDDLSDLEAQLPGILGLEGPVFVALKVVRGVAKRTALPNHFREARRFKAVMDALP